MNVLFVNLMRLGDNFQMQAAISDVIAAGHSVGVVTLSIFSPAVKFLRGITWSYSIEPKLFLDNLPSEVDETGKNWRKSLGDLYLWRESIEQEMSPDIIINITPNRAGRVFTAFLSKGKKQVFGFSIDKYGFAYNSNSWTAHISSTAAGRKFSPFNFVDVLRKISTPISTFEVSPTASMLIKPSAEKVEQMISQLYYYAPKETKGFVALQLGASDSKRQWPISSFVGVGKSLWEERQLCPILVGGYGETCLSDQYKEISDHPHISLIGRTDLIGLGEVLSSCSLLITNDTGTMHLASGLNIPILSIFLATAQPFDTGAYQEGCCSVEPDLACHPCNYNEECSKKYICKKSISAKSIAYLALNKLKENVWLKDGCNLGMRVWESRLNKYNLMELKSLSGHEKEFRSIWIVWLSCLLRQLFDSGNSTTIDFFIDDSLPKFPFEMVGVLHSESHEILSLLTLLEAQLSLMAKQPSYAFEGKIRKTWDLLDKSFYQSSLFKTLAYLITDHINIESEKIDDLRIAILKFRKLMEFCHSIS